jgi:hypothetical protein
MISLNRNVKKQRSTTRLTSLTVANLSTVALETRRRSKRKSERRKSGKQRNIHFVKGKTSSTGAVVPRQRPILHKRMTRFQKLKRSNDSYTVSTVDF